MPTPMGTGPEPRPTDVTPYPYPKYPTTSTTAERPPAECICDAGRTFGPGGDPPSTDPACPQHGHLVPGNATHVCGPPDAPCECHERAEHELCICDPNPMTTEGPLPECDVHGQPSAAYKAGYAAGERDANELARWRAPLLADPVRAAVRRALAEHQPARKKYNDDGTITKHCRCGLATDGATLTPRTQHLEDVIVEALALGSTGPADADVIRNAALAALQEPGVLPNREAYQSWDLNLLTYAIASRVTAGVTAALHAASAPLPTRDEVLLVARAAVAGTALGRPERTAAAVIDALHDVGMLAYRDPADAEVAALTDSTGAPNGAQF